MAGFIGSGNVLGERFVGGVSQGLIRLGNAQKLEIKENSDKKTRSSKKRENYGSALDTVVIKKPADVMITLDDLDRDNLSLVFMGSVDTASVVASAVTGETHTAGEPGTMIALGSGNVSSVTITGFVEGTDFVVEDADAGLVTLVDGGGIAKGDALVCAYSTGGYSGSVIKGGTNPDVTMKIIMLGTNLVTQEPVRVEIGKAIMTPESGVDFLSEDFTELQLTGVANVPDGAVEAYTVELNRVNA